MAIAVLTATWLIWGLEPNQIGIPWSFDPVDKENTLVRGPIDQQWEYEEDVIQYFMVL